MSDLDDADGLGSRSIPVGRLCQEAAAALAESVQECPHGVTDGNCKECYGVATNSEPITVYSVPLRCHNCASLEAQNTELDRKLADLEQTSLELCETCGWRTVIPGEGCLNCAHSKPLTEEEIEKATREVWRNLPSDFDYTTSSWVEVGIRYAERAHGIKQWHS